MVKSLLGPAVAIIVGAALIMSTANSSKADGAAPMLMFIGGAVLALVGLIWGIVALTRRNRAPRA